MASPNQAHRHAYYGSSVLSAQSPVLEVLSRSSTDIDNNIRQPSLHAHRSTNPPEMHNLPALLQLSEANNSEHHGAQVSNQHQKQKQKLKMQRKKTLPNKPLPTRPLPTKPLPSNPINNRERANTNPKDVKHVLGTIQIHHNTNTHNVKPITFNYNYNTTPTRNKSHTVVVARPVRPSQRRDHNRRNLVHINQQRQKPNMIRSKTPEPRHRTSIKQKVITPTPATKNSEKELMINRLNRQYSIDNTEASSDSESLSHSNSINTKMKTIPSIGYHEDKAPPRAPPGVYRKKPESPQYRKEHLQRRESRQKRHKPIKPMKSMTPGIMQATSRLRIKSTPNIAKRIKSTPYSIGQRSPQTPMLSMSSTSQTHLTNEFDEKPMKTHKNMNTKQIAQSDTLYCIKQREQRVMHQQRIPNVEQLFEQQGAKIDEEMQYNDAQKAFRKQEMKRSSINLSKRILESHKSKQDSKEIALPASFAKYKDFKKSYSISISKEEEKEEQSNGNGNDEEKGNGNDNDNDDLFIPPAPPSNNGNDSGSQHRMKYIESGSEEDDDFEEDGMQYLDYLNGNGARTTHVVSNSIDPGTGDADSKKHKRGRSNSVPNIGTMYRINADNVNDSASDSDSQEKERNNKERIKNLKISTPNNSNKATSGAPFEVVIDIDDDDDDDDDDDTEIVILEKGRKNTRSRTRSKGRTKTGLTRSKSNHPPSTDTKHRHKSHGMERSAEFEDVASIISAPAHTSIGLKRKKKWYHGIFGKPHKVDNTNYTNIDWDAQSIQSDKQSLMDIASLSTYSLSSAATGTATVTDDDDMIRTRIFSEIELTNTQVAQEILSFASSDWNYDHDALNVYRAQCATLNYAEFIPNLAQLIYPTITSSLSLPMNAQSQSISYSVYCKYNLEQFRIAAELKQNEETEEKSSRFIGESVSTFDLHEIGDNNLNPSSILFHHHHDFNANLKSEEIEMVSFRFSHETTTQEAIKQIFNEICTNAPSYQLKIQLQFLYLENFVLKTCGREEYLRFSDDLLIVSSNYIRNCLRHNEYKQLEFVLFYIHDLNTYNDIKYRQSLKLWYRDNTYDDDIFEYYAQKPLVSDIVNRNKNNKLLKVIDENEEAIISAKKKQKIKEKQLKYEHLGYNCIVDTLMASNEKDKLSQLNLAVESEVEWLYSTIGTVLNQHNSSSTALNEQIEIDWQNIAQSAVLLDEFEHPIELKLKSLKNICNAPRYKLRNPDFLLIRIELMFGSNTFSECSWDIRIPSQSITSNVKIPVPISTFSSEIHQLYYSMLPREATWCFTIYGVTQNTEYQQSKTTKSENKTKKTKSKKVKLKHIDNLNVYDNGENSAYSDLNYSVSSDFKLFNKSSSNKLSSSSSRNRYSSYSSYTASDAPSSPYTPRGGQLKTKTKNIMYSSRSDTGSSSKDTASTVSTTTQTSTYNGISVCLSTQNAHIVQDDGAAEEEEEEDDDGGLDEEEDGKTPTKQYFTEALAWCRLPVISHRHCIRSGSFQLHLWSVPLFKSSKGGAKCDRYTTGFWKKFGTTSDRRILSTIGNNLDIVLGIEFPHFPFDIVAALVNPRRPEYVLRSIKPYKRREFPGKQVLLEIIEQDGITPLDDKDQMLVYSNKEKLMRYPGAIATFLRSVDWLDVELRMEAYDYLFRWKCASHPEDMIELLRSEFGDTRIRLYSINCLNQLDDYTLNRYLLQLVQALKNELQHNSFLSRFLIFRALRSPSQIGHYLFWHFLSEYISSCVSCEYHWSERYGLLMEEYLLHLPNNLENIGVNYSKQLLAQNNLMNRLGEISSKIQFYKKKNKLSNHKLSLFLRRELMLLNSELGCRNESIGLPLDASLRCLKLQISRCKFMSSAKAPLWLVWDNADPYAKMNKKEVKKDENFSKNKKKKSKKEKKKDKKYSKYGYFASRDDINDNVYDIQVMYKCGDDLRQDILTLQLISVMDAFWLEKNCDLRMKPYRVVQTGHRSGIIELIVDSKTTNDIHSKHGTIRGAFNHKAHLIYLQCCAALNKDEREHQKYAQDIAFKNAQENYARSCAGYSVATWVLGIGDRHPSNIMIHKNGYVFHIDFGHFLGNFKEKQIGGGLIKFNRERSPFVFTSLMKYAIDEGIDDAQLYREFVQWIFKAYSEVRCRYKFFLNLFLLMIPSHLPELIREYDVKYLRTALRHDLTNFQDLALHVEKTLKQCLNDKYRLVDNGIHARKHAN